jgi:hypothetical protein
VDASTAAPPTRSAVSRSAAGLFASPPASRIARPGRVVIDTFVAPPETMKSATTAAYVVTHSRHTAPSWKKDAHAR